jgi:predicted porin
LNSATYGQVTFGRQYTTIYDALVNFDPFFTGATYSPLIAMLGLATRDDNMTKYTGTFGPITLEGHWSFGAGTSPLMVTPLANGGTGQVPGHFRDDTAYGAALTFTRGPFSATVALDQWNPAITTGNAGSARKLAGAASYKLGPATVMGGYRWGNTKDSFDTVLLRDDFYWAGITYQVTPAFFLSGAYYYDNIKSLRVSPVAPSTNPANPWQVALVADYFLSKRTDIYIASAFAKNAALDLDSVATGYAYGYSLAQGATNQLGVAIGIRHKF